MARDFTTGHTIKQKKQNVRINESIGRTNNIDRSQRSPKRRWKHRALWRNTTTDWQKERKKDRFLEFVDGFKGGDWETSHRYGRLPNSIWRYKRSNARGKQEEEWITRSWGGQKIRLEKNGVFNETFINLVWITIPVSRKKPERTTTRDENTRWTPRVEMTLVMGWVAISEDGHIRNAQSNDSFWKPFWTTSVTNWVALNGYTTN